MILSASGWRKVFSQGGEESHSSDLAQDDLVLCAGMAWVFARFLIDKKGILRPCIILGWDSRFTGPTMANVMIRLLLTMNVNLRLVEIVSMPALMGLIQLSHDVDGFIYITASHNPVGYNGLKWGLADGGVLEGPQSNLLAQELLKALNDLSLIRQWIELVNDADVKLLKQVISQSVRFKQLCRQKYWAMCDKIIGFEKDLKQQKIIKTDLRKQISSAKLGIVAEFNGSARGCGIDQDYLEDLGVQVIALNARPGEFVHGIVPEGESLELCCRELKRAWAQDNRFILGYVPDCDGDRGNIVYFDKKSQKAKSLESQEVFALCVVSELANLVYHHQLTYDQKGNPCKQVAVVCNDPTSLRIDRIANAFGASVFRAEVGEANVVALARKLRQSGWIVRILGEGSNGGNITHPGAVRDPLSTLISLLKLLTVKDSEKRLGLFSLWCTKTGQIAVKDFALADIIATLPSFFTTPSYEPRALLTLKSTSHATFKAAYEAHFLNQGWKQKHHELELKKGICSWEERNYEGTEERCGFGSSFRRGKERGGLKILLKNKQETFVGFLWMRGSGTEPVFRVLVDIEGSPELEQELLDWHVSMIRAADNQFIADFKQQ